MTPGFPRRRWISPEVDGGEARDLADALALPGPIATVLLGRGHRDPERLDPFLNPRLADLADPDTLPNMAAAVDRVWAALDAGEPMLVFGDYDVDGLCSTALAIDVLRALGGQVRGFLPNRQDHGYGLSVAALNAALAVDVPPRLLITVDCGTGSAEAVAAAGALGIDVIVTDHHEPDATLAAPLALVNPKLVPGHPAEGLAGVGVAFKLCHALVKRGLREGRAVARALDLRHYLDLVAVATVADVVPLVGENRVLVRHGLQRLNTAPRLGLRALMDAAGIAGRTLDCHHIGFVLGPRLNAAGRLGGAEGALELLLTQDPALAARRARELDRANQDRKTIETRMLRDAEAELESAVRAGELFGLVVGNVAWHLGTAGIVASRLVGRFGRPALVVAIDAQGRGRGSCRGIDRLDILAVLQECADLLDKFGGHKMAAGVEVAAERLPALRERFNAACRSRLEGLDLRPVQRVDAWIRLAEADGRLLRALDRLRPMGSGNPEPYWGLRRVRLAAPPGRVGREQQHLKLLLAQGGSQIAAVGFNLGGVPVPEGELDLVVQVREHWRGEGVELEVADLRPALKNVAADGCEMYSGAALG